MWLVLALGCRETAQPPPAEATRAAGARGAITDGFVQSCSPEPGCPPDSTYFQPAWCTERQEPFAPTVVDGDLVAVDIDPAAGTAIGLAHGTWWTAWRPTDGTCESLFVSLEILP